MKKNNLITFGLVLVLSLLAIFLRLLPIQLATINKIARAEVHNESLEKVKEDINKMYPNLPEDKKQKIIQRSHKKYLKQNSYLIKEKINKKKQEKKAFYQNDNNHTYVFGIDSYYWLRLIDNLIHKGHIGDHIQKGVNYDDLIGLPIEQSLSRSMHIILGSLIYKLFGFLKLNIDYEIGLYFIPLLFSILLVIVTFFITKMISQSNIAAFFATIAVNLSPLFLQRVMGEWLDTDIYNVFFPLLIFGAFLYVFKSNTIIKKILSLIVFSFACSFYASVWQGWWHIFDLLVLSGLVFILNDYFSEGNDKVLFNRNMLWLLLLFICGLLLVGLFNGKESWLSFIWEPKKLIFALKNVPKDNWPNVFLTVAELKKISAYRLAQEVGGVFIFFVTILGSIYLVLFKKIIRDRESGIGFFCLFIWLGAIYYTSLNAVRFALLLIAPLGIMFGIVFDKIIQTIFNFSLNFSKKIHFSVLGFLIAVVYLFVSFNVARSTEIALYKLPMINDSWYNALTFIRDNLDKNTIINTWWDYGHWYKFIAQRRVLFDGKTQNSPIAFWMAKVLTSDDEKEAVGILRMLDKSKNEAFDLLKSYGFSAVKIVDILREITKLSEKDARQYLERLLDKERIDKLMPLIFDKDISPACFIVSYDLLGKMRPISFIGNWDFKKGDIWIKFRQKHPDEFINYLIKEYDYSKEEAINLSIDLSLFNDVDARSWISKLNNLYFETMSNKFKKEENLLLFDNGLVVDLSNYNAYVLRGYNVDIGVPYSIVYLEDGILKEKILENSNLGHSVLLFKKDTDSYGSIFIDKDLAKSMLVRMYFLEGQGLQYFKKLIQEKTPEGNLIYAYDIEWPK